MSAVHVRVCAHSRFAYHFYNMSKRIIDQKTDGHEVHVGFRLKMEAALDAIAHQRATGWLLRGICLVVRKPSAPQPNRPPTRAPTALPILA